MFLCTVVFDEIVVNTDFPERNREVRIIPFSDVEVNGVLHGGFEISMDADIHDYLEDHYSAQIVTESQILLSIPSVPYTYLHKYDKFFSVVDSFALDCPRTQIGHNVVRNAIKEDSTRATKYLLLSFPPGTVFDTRHYVDGTGTLLDATLIPFKIDFEHSGRTHNRTRDVVYWKVATKEAKERRVSTQASGKTKGASQLEALFSGMSMGSL